MLMMPSFEPPRPRSRPVAPEYSKPMAMLPGSSRLMSTEYCWTYGALLSWSMNSMWLPTPASAPSELPTGCRTPPGNGLVSDVGRTELRPGR